jgi:hypothetical protein
LTSGVNHSRDAFVLLDQLAFPDPARLRFMAARGRKAPVETAYNDFEAVLEHSMA